MNLFILAAGLGTRFKPLTLKMPKPTIRFLNVAMGYYNFRFLKKLNPSIHSFVVNTHHLPQQIEDLYNAKNFLTAPAQFSNEKDVILGTAGGIKHAEHLFKKDEPILMMNADEIIFTENDDFLSDALNQHKKNNALATLIVTKHPEVGKKFGAILCKDKSVHLISKTIPENTDLEAWHYVGIIILSWDVLKLIPKDIEQNIFYDVLLKHLNTVQIYPIDSDWYETGNQVDFKEAAQTVLSQLAKPVVNNKYKNVLNFINEVDPSAIVKTDSTLSLVSKAIAVDSKKLKNFNCIAYDSKINAVDEIHDCIAFADEILK